MQFLIKVIAIYPSNKSEFNNINNDGRGELAYFWLANS